LRGEKGFALVITLLVTALLVALCAEFVGEVYVETSLTHNFVAGQQASLLAASGVEGAKALLAFTRATQKYTTLSDPWAKPQKMEDERGALVVTIEDESGKLNFNRVATPGGTVDQTSFYYLSAVNLVKKLGLSADLVQALVDWLDSDDTPQPGGAESAYYLALRPPYRAKNNALDTLEELSLVKGFGGGVVERLKPFVTVYAEDPNPMAAVQININTAPKEVLASLQGTAGSMTDSLAQQVIDYRKTTPFQDSTELTKVPGMATIGQGLQTYVTHKGSVFRIRSEARVREATRVVEAVVRMNGLGTKVIYWREYTP
jgi:general secretion pathway protein K